MKLIFHGGAQEVGRSCIELRTGGDRYLLDCGVKFHAGGMDYPAKVFDTRALDGVFLSHAHLDHSGGLPFFEHYQMRCPIFCTPETKEMIKVLLKDSYRLGKMKHKCEPYEKPEMLKVFDDVEFVKFDQDRRFRSISFRYCNAGHIPGSASVRIEAEGKTILYSGDYNTVDTELMIASRPASWGKVDVLITESTYGLTDHEDRIVIKERLLRKVQEVVDRGGRVLIPVFAVGRAQEVLLILGERKWGVPIYLDGMAKQITKIVARGKSQYVRDRQKLRKMHDLVDEIDNPHEREEVKDRPGIFIATSGMLEGGPARGYMDHICQDEKSAVLLSGFQVQHTRGWWLAENRTWKVDGQISQVKCDVERFDFSAHLSRSDIQRAIAEAKPGMVILNHGSPDAIEAMRQWLEQQGIRVFVPRVGDEIEIDGGASMQRAYTSDDGYPFPEEHQHGDTCAPAVEHDE